MNVYHLDTQDGFTCGDTETGHTGYAYPSSVHARAAKKDPAATAAEMLRQANYSNQFCLRDVVLSANSRNWARLNAR